MPELPEVETIRNNLRNGALETPALPGRVFSRAHVLWVRSIAKPTTDEFQVRLPGQKIEDIGRRGKYIVFHLSEDTLLVHLRMSGDLLVGPQTVDFAPHARLALDFQDGLQLVFSDARKFGRVWLVGDPLEVLSGLGPEPFDAEFTSEMLYLRLRATRRQLKPLLLDQTFLAGLGNIYTDEALHLARLHPLTRSDQVTRDGAERLWMAIRQVLEDGIRRNGASIDWVYRGGEFQNYFRVYQRTGQACLVCGATVQRIVVGQRGTHFCPGCQGQDNE